MNQPALYAFISSPVRGLDDVRASIHELATDDRLIWVDEIDKPRPRDEPSFTTIEDLFRLIRAAERFIVLLGSERHGSGLRVGEEVAHVSYWEAELFYAVLLGKRIEVFELQDFRPGAELAGLLSVLHDAIPKSSWSGPHSGAVVIDAVRRALDTPLPTIPSRTRGRAVRTLVNGLFALRGRDGQGGAAETESLRFLGGRFLDRSVAPNERIITRLLDEVRATRNEEGRLTRLWVVLRELSGARAADEKDFLPYWNRFFGEWASAGSWYGLHGHPYLAVLPSLVEQTRIRARMRVLSSAAWKDQDSGYPGGSLASSRYSIAGLAGIGPTRRFLLNAALRDLERSLEERHHEPTNLLAIRGSVYRRMGAISAAVHDYQEVLRRRRAAAAPDDAIGEALAELGFGYLFQLRLWRGRSFLEEGVRLMTASTTRPGFLVRAMKKLAVAYAVTGHPFRSRDVLLSARAIARDHAVYDQDRSAMR